MIMGPTKQGKSTLFNKITLCDPPRETGKIRPTETNLEPVLSNEILFYESNGITGENKSDDMIKLESFFMENMVDIILFVVKSFFSSKYLY